MAPDPGLLGAIVSEVVRSSDPGTTVLFTSRGAATPELHRTATDIASRAGLVDCAGWSLVSTSAEPSLAAALDELADTHSSAGAVVVSLDGETVAVPSGHGEGVDVAVLEVGT